MNIKNQEKMGINRTGIDISPLLSKAMLNETEELTLPRCPVGDDEAIAQNRMQTIREVKGLGSIPIPATFKGLAVTALEKLKNTHPEILMDKLGERLAFERAGVRLYQALISKFQIDEGRFSSVASLKRLEEICEQELQHFLLLSKVIESLGGDSTAVTPSADVTAMTSMGIVKVLADPRVNFIQSLDAILVAELSDNDCWSHLIELTRHAGLNEVSEKFEECYRDEQEHLITIREWVTQFGLGKEPHAESEVA